MIPSILDFCLIARARISIPRTKSMPDKGHPCLTEKFRGKTIARDTACGIAVKCLNPIFEVGTKMKLLKNLKKEVPFNRIKGFFKVKENRETREVLGCGVTDDIAYKSYVFSDIPSFDIASLIRIYYVW